MKNIYELYQSFRDKIIESGIEFTKQMGIYEYNILHVHVFMLLNNTQFK